MLSVKIIGYSIEHSFHFCQPVLIVPLLLLLIFLELLQPLPLPLADSLA
jgi:hypothetical protein